MISAVRQTSDGIGSLLVFADDWGRHPSSCQHLVRQLMSRIPVTWVNTIGTRTPRLDLATLRRVREKLVQWSRRPDASDHIRLPSAPASVDEPTVLNPRMWPWFTQPRDRALNRWLLQRQLGPVIRQMPQPVVALTTLPITADLSGCLPVDRWVYYCVDDFSAWPGLDGGTLREMDRRMIAAADQLLAVSEPLQQKIAAEGRTATLLTHGVDINFWKQPPGSDAGAPVPAPADQTPDRLLCGLPEPLVVFWGVIDRRMDSGMIRELSNDLQQGTILLVGPQQDPDPRIAACPKVRLVPAQPMRQLPSIARRAAVLIMPYADLPVTRAMQPLKLKEYLATGKPVVASRLPAVRPWSDCMDVAESPRQFSEIVRNRIRIGADNAQIAARERLVGESWCARAETLEQILSGHFMDTPVPDRLRSTGRRQLSECRPL